MCVNKVVKRIQSELFKDLIQLECKEVIRHQHGERNQEFVLSATYNGVNVPINLKHSTKHHLEELNRFKFPDISKENLELLFSLGVQCELNIFDDYRVVAFTFKKDEVDIEVLFDKYGYAEINKSYYNVVSGGSFKRKIETSVKNRFKAEHFNDFFFVELSQTD